MRQSYGAIRETRGRRRAMANRRVPQANMRGPGPSGGTRWRWRASGRFRQNARTMRRESLHRVAVLAWRGRRVGRALEQSAGAPPAGRKAVAERMQADADDRAAREVVDRDAVARGAPCGFQDRKSTRLNSSH